METYWIVLIFSGAIVVTGVVGKLLGINFTFVLTALREMLQSVKINAKENKVKKGKKDV